MPRLRGGSTVSTGPDGGQDGAPRCEPASGAALRGGTFSTRDGLRKGGGRQEDESMKAKTSWVLVADGARARIVRDLGMDTGAEDRLDDLVYEIDHKQLREIMADKPGRGFASEGARRSAMEYRSDPVQEQEVEFAGMLLDELERRHAADEFGRLAIVAEPRMLGTLRQKLPAALRQAVVKEVPKDLTKLPVKELREALAALD